MPLVLEPLGFTKAWPTTGELQSLLILVTSVCYPIFFMHLLRLISALSSASLAAAWTTYTVPHSSGKDDTPALAAAFNADKSLTTNATILFQKGVTYNMATPITFPNFQNVIVSIQGNITYGADIKATQGENSETTCRELSMLTFGARSHQQLLRLRYVTLLLPDNFMR